MTEVKFYFQERIEEIIRLMWYEGRPIKGTFNDYFYDETTNEIRIDTLPIVEFIDGISQIHRLLDLPYDQKVIKNLTGRDYFMVANLNGGLGLEFDRLTKKSTIFQMWEDSGYWGVQMEYTEPLGKDSKKWWKNNLISLISNTHFSGYKDYPYQQLIEKVWYFNFSNKISYP